jgi:hypothetical protein
MGNSTHIKWVVFVRIYPYRRKIYPVILQSEIRPLLKIFVCVMRKDNLYQYKIRDGGAT